ncbi:hypothetical protein RRG08_019175 [Elysia crispata]|uniref:Uncharacterized protein n=1 Tax=Elysia crispata TaxID=231223 RepID=A0AAE1CXP6_9GAST|nr:hypothetical protein RRG08_019175 [Elysia crispata]
MGSNYFEFSKRLKRLDGSPLRMHFSSMTSSERRSTRQITENGHHLSQFVKCFSEQLRYRTSLQSSGLDETGLGSILYSSHMPP